MIQRLKKVLKNSVLPFINFEALEPFRYAAARRVANKSAHNAVSMLLLSEDAVYTSEQQLTPFFEHRMGLSRNFGLTIRRGLIRNGALPESISLNKYDIVGLKINGFAKAVYSARIINDVKSRMAPESRLVYFDGDDDLCITWPDLLPEFDLYVKKHCFADRNEYLKRRIGKTNLTDYVSKKFGTSFEDNFFPSSGPAAIEQLPKIVVGWNVAYDACLRKPAQPLTAHQKTIDVICRAAPTPDWAEPLRSIPRDILEKLSDEFDVRTSRTRVPFAEYSREMLSSRICVSPFGYGEICWRDFEAVFSGCVLVKPDMSHIETYPDIFVPGVTYEPVAWDYSDLEDVLRRLLADPEYCDFLRGNATRALASASTPAAVQQRIIGVLGPVLG